MKGLQNSDKIYSYIKSSNHNSKVKRLAIDQFVKDQFSSNGGKNLRFKWVKATNAKCAEGDYLECMQEKLGYWPEYNKKRGNKCN